MIGRRALGTVLAAAAMVAGTVAAAPSAQAARCGGTSGVTVIVDKTAFGKGTAVRCAPGDPTSGLAALTGAAFSYSFVPRFPGMICRIDALPATCAPPTTTAYWSYWHATPGGTWTYSSVGAGAFNPAPGTIEGWAFGAGKPPRVKP